MKREKIVDIVGTYIRQEFGVEANDSRLSDDIDLFENGIVDSVGIVGLISFIEQKFDLRFDEEMLYDDRFSSLNGIAGIISELKSY